MKTGRPMTEDGKVARVLGLPRAEDVRRLGGAEKLKHMSPNALAILLGPHVRGNSQTARKGELAARGLFMGKRGVDTQREYLIPPPAEFDMPLDVLLSDEDLDLPEVEGLGE